MSTSPSHDGGKNAKSRRELPTGAVATLKAWLLSPEHFSHPYPTPQDQIMLMQKTGIDKKQLKNWFTNARRRIWKPMLKKQLEDGKLTATGTPAPGVAPAPQQQQIVASPSTMPVAEASVAQAIHTQYSQIPPPPPPPPNAAASEPQSYDVYGNPIYTTTAAPATTNAGVAPPPTTAIATSPYSTTPSHPANSAIAMPPSSIPSFGSLPNMNKTDSHAVLMELFARDQDLVKHATEQNANRASATLSQPPLRVPSSTKLVHVPTLDSWPHFSSISSLNNMTGVKSITSMSGADLASQGNLNQKGNLAQVKSMESLGKHDSYAFLEVFFGDKTIRNQNSSNAAHPANMSSSTVKREDNMDHDVGLSLDADEGPSSTSAAGSTFVGGRPLGASNTVAVAVPTTAALTPATPSTTVPTMTTTATAADMEGGKTDTTSAADKGTTMKRAYDDAMAARGLISVSRSSERLTDMALPAKIQRTLSQNFLREHQAKAQKQQQQQQQAAVAAGVGGQQPQPQQQQPVYDTPPGATATTVPAAASSQQYPGQAPQQQQQLQATAPTPAAAAAAAAAAASDEGTSNTATVMAATSTTNDSSTSSNNKPPPNAICAFCKTSGRVDAQLKPCGHMFHEHCIKPSLNTPGVQPKCPIDGIPIESVLVAVQAPPEANSVKQPSVPWGTPNKLEPTRATTV